MTIAAKYENGVFKPLEGVVIAEGTVVEVHVPVGREGKRHSIRELGFADMWADRDDIKDGILYVRSLRDDPRGARALTADSYQQPPCIW
jgi:predicted DNA-binding antitoxin AbrB/MazE fold protein